MILEVLAAATVAAPASIPTPAEPPTVSPVTVNPAPKEPPAATIDVPMDDTALGQWASVWPTGAYQAHISGHVLLSCDIDRHGLAEWCQVASEQPKHLGFGAAAMELRPTFKLKPAAGGDEPVDQMVTIAVEFQARAAQYDWGGHRDGGPTGEKTQGGNDISDVTGFGGPALVARSVAMLNNPVWTSTVGYDDVQRAYPAKAGGVDGYAVAHCEVSRGGNLRACQVIKEDPPTHGFGKAALALASRFRVSPEWVTAPHHADVWVDIPFRFPAPGQAESRTLAAPYWVSGFDPDQALKLFPPEAAARGVTTGHGVAKCVVAPDGTLTDCAPLEAEPDGLGFSEAAAKLVSTMRMNPWTIDGAPVDGTIVRVGVRLNLKAGG